jgi:hypothetical protein
MPQRFQAILDGGEHGVMLVAGWDILPDLMVATPSGRRAESDLPRLIRTAP